MSSRGMSREAAVVAIVTEDDRERRAGRPSLIEGPPLKILYAEEMEGELTDDEAVLVVAYLLDVSEEEAREDLNHRAATGSITYIRKH
jgi:hypothetical protein